MADDYTPEGYKDPGEFLEEARERWQEGADADRENREEDETDREFLAGEQWTAEDKKARKGRPCLMINQLPQFVTQVIGDIRINKPGIKVRPAQDADKDLAEVREGLIRAIENDSKGQNVYAETALQTVTGGLGNFRVVLEYARNDAFERDIKIKRIENAYSVVWDPFITDPTGKDANWAFIGDEMPRKAFEAKYPDEAPSDLGSLGDSLARNGWLTKDVVRVTEYWKRKEAPAEIGLLESGAVEWITKENEAQIVPQLVRNNRGDVMRRKTMKTSVCMYLITGHAILEPPVEYQISRIPIFRVPGWELHVKGKKKRWGLVRFARDPQRLKNYWRSVSAEKLALAPRQQWLIHESQDGEQDNFREAAESGDTVLTWSGQIEPKRLEPPQIEAALLNEAQVNAQDMKDVTGIHDASLGIKSNETSGKAILARQREGDVATFIYSDNLHLAIGECGSVINELIPATMDTVREIRVLGADDQQRVMRVNDLGDPNSIDLSKGKFDIVVESGPSYSTKRVETAEALTALVQAVPIIGQVAADLVVRAQDVPDADVIADRIKRSMPPQITQDPKEPPSPEQQQQAQAQQQAQDQHMQIQMAGLQIEMRTKEAQAQTAEANAAAAKANAALAYFNLELAQSGANGKDPRLMAAQADKTEAEAMRAHIGALSEYQTLHTAPLLAQAQASEMDARAAKAHVDVAHHIADLHAKPLDVAHSVVDLAQKINPPEPVEPAGA